MSETVPQRDRGFTHSEERKMRTMNGTWVGMKVASAVAGLAALALLVGPTTALAQEQEAEAQAPPTADPADVESIDAIMTAVYDVISGEAGEARDWDRFMSLFIPEARLIPSGRNQEGQHGRLVAAAVRRDGRSAEKTASGA